MNVFAKLCYFALLPCWALAVFPPINPVNIMANGLPDVTKELRFDQELDHFKFTDTRTWGQRYTINYDHYKVGAPILFIVGGQEDITSPTTMAASGVIVDYAKQTNALILCLEHRYFGQSFPTKDLSTENLEYLNSEQALADLASFITDMPKLYPEGIPCTAKWIAFGESRGATLAARLRLKHSHLVIAAVSSSGPLLEKTNFNEYFVFMDEQLNNMIPGITERIKKAYKMINAAVNRPVIQSVEIKFTLCNSLNNGQKDKNVIFLYWTLANLLSTVMQYGNHKSFKQTLQFVINEMTNNSESGALVRFANVINKIRMFFQRPCLNSDYGTIVEAFKDQSVNGDMYTNNLLIAGTGSRQALYQNCTEYGQFETSDNYNIQLDFYDNLCIDVFGEQYGLKALNSAVNRSVAFYGGLDIDVNHAIFVNGSLDAWSKLSITETTTNDRVAVFIEGASHCDAMSSTVDNSELALAQTYILKILKEWLNENCENNLLSIRVE